MLPAVGEIDTGRLCPSPNHYRVSAIEEINQLRDVCAGRQEVAWETIQHDDMPEIIMNIFIIDFFIIYYFPVYYLIMIINILLYYFKHIYYNTLQKLHLYTNNAPFLR